MFLIIAAVPDSVVVWCNITILTYVTKKSDSETLLWDNLSLEIFFVVAWWVYMWQIEDNKVRLRYKWQVYWPATKLPCHVWNTSDSGYRFKSITHFGPSGH